MIGVCWNSTCHYTCNTCNGPEFNHCLTCYGGSFLNGGVCYKCNDYC